MSTVGTIRRRTPLTGVNNPAYQESLTVANDSLIIASAAADGAVAVRDSANPDGWGFTVLTKADVGLGLVENTALSTWAGSAAITTVGPLSTLIVGGQVAPAGVEGYFASISAADPRGVMSAQYTTDAVGARFHLRKGRGTEAAPTTIVTGDVLGRVRFSGYDGANYLQSGSIDVVSIGTIAATRVPTVMTFSVATDAAPSVLTEVLRLSAPVTSSVAPMVSIPGSGAATFLQATFTDTGAVGQYNFCVGHGPNAGDGTRDDHVLTVGYNTRTGGGRAILTEPCFEWRIEDYYAPTASPKYVEAQWQYYDAAGAGYRPIAIQIDRAVGAYVTNATMSLKGSSVGYIGMDGVQYVQFLAGQLLMMNGANIAANAATFAGDVALDAIRSLKFSSAGYVTGNSVTGQFLLRNLTVSAGVGLDVATDAVLKIRNRAHTGYAAIASGASGIAVTSTDGYVLENETLSTAGVPVQQSPRFRIRSHVWNTTAVAADNTDDWWIEVLPSSGTTPSSLMRFGKSLNGGAVTYPLTFSSNGNITALNVLIANNGVNVNNNQNISWGSASILSSLGDGQLNLRKNDQTTGTGLDFATTAVLKVRTLAQTGYATVDALGYRINGGAGAIVSADEFMKSVAAIADATLTTVLTITIPNAAHSAQVSVVVVGSLGAGGAVGANEATAVNSYTVTITRTAGVNAVATVSAASGAAAAAVAGAATVTATLTAAAVVGAVGASNTIDLKVTITRSGGASTNHTCQVFARILNANATGVTLA
jgi:hypothetical protein